MPAKMPVRPPLYRMTRRHGDDVINYVGTHNITNGKEVNNLKHI